MAGIMLTATNGEPSLAFICFFGIAVVFAGLVILIGLIYLVNRLSDILFKVKAENEGPASVPAPTQAQPSAEIANRSELVAAVCAAVAEEEGTDVSAIRVISFKKL